MSKPSFSLWSMIAAVSLMLAILPFGNNSYAVQSSPAQVTGGEAAADDPTPAMYIVRLQDEPLSSYTGGISRT